MLTFILLSFSFFTLLFVSYRHYYIPEKKHQGKEKMKIFTFWYEDNTEYTYLTLNVLQLTFPSEKYELVVIDEFNINDYASELNGITNNPEYLKIFLLEKYGGVWIDINTILLKNPTWLFDLENYDFVCFGNDVKVMASRKNGKIINNIKDKIMDTTINREKLIELTKDEIQHNDLVLHHCSNINGVLDKDNRVITTERMLTNDFNFKDFYQSENVHFIHLDKDYLYDTYFGKDNNVYSILCQDSFLAKTIRSVFTPE